MPRYATDTTVPVERTKQEIEHLLVRYKAKEFMSGWGEASATIGFRLDKLTMRFLLPIPPMSDERFRYRMVRGRKVKATDTQAMNRWEQEQRSRWRALQLVVKAKLEAVECGISTLEQEFLAFIVMPDNVTIGDYLVKNVLPSIKSGHMPLALTAKKDDDIEDAEVINPDGNRK